METQVKTVPQPQAQSPRTDSSLYIHDDSMNDGTCRGFKAGDKVICEQITKADFKRMLSSEPKRFICINKKGGTHIGYITSNGLDKGVLCIKPANLAYKSELLRLSSLKEVYLISPLFRNGSRNQSVPLTKGSIEWIGGKGWGAVKVC